MWKNILSHSSLICLEMIPSIASLTTLRCTQEEQEPITLCQVLSNSYPFVFNYRGFSKEELFRATDGHGVDPSLCGA